MRNSSIVQVAEKKKDKEISIRSVGYIKKHLSLEPALKKGISLLKKKKRGLVKYAIIGNKRERGQGWQD